MHVFNAFRQKIKNMKIMNLYQQFAFNKYKDKLYFFSYINNNYFILYKA